MSNSNQEIIEARLASYVDGEIDAGEQAEIERHLNQNPQYRRLLDDLRKTREMLRALPRESAPGEFSDAFFSQLERSSLLDGPADSEPANIRMPAWSPILAAAAILLLTLGLATIVYFVLPGHSPRTLAQGKPPAPASAVPGPAPTEPADADATEHGNNAGHPLGAGNNKVAISVPVHGAPDRAVVNASAPAGAAPSTVPAEQGAPSPAIAEDSLHQAASELAQDPRVLAILAGPSGAPDAAHGGAAASPDAVVLLVRSANAEQVRGEIDRYAASNQLSLQPISSIGEAIAGTQPTSQSAEQAAKSQPAVAVAVGLPSDEKQKSPEPNLDLKSSPAASPATRPSETGPVADALTQASAQAGPARQFFMVRRLSQEQARNLAREISGQAQVAQAQVYATSASAVAKGADEPSLPAPPSTTLPANAEAGARKIAAPAVAATQPSETADRSPAEHNDSAIARDAGSATTRPATDAGNAPPVDVVIVLEQSSSPAPMSPESPMTRPAPAPTTQDAATRPSL